MWGFSKPVQQERVHLQFCKKLLGVKKSTQNDFIYGELGRVSLQTSILYSVINCWFKILESEQRIYIKYAYKMLVTDLENRPNSINWVSKVRDLLSTLCFHEVWLSQGIGNKNNVLAEFKIRLNDNFVQNWNSRISESSRATFYSLSSNFNFQLYLETVKVKIFRIALSKLRLSSH